MIIRNVLQPDFDFNNFDFFNDYKDTITWLIMIDRQDTKDKLIKSYTNWIKSNVKTNHDSLDSG